MALLKVNGTELFVESFGEGPETIIFTHALFFSGQMYAQQIAALSDKYRCITIDWRGMGRSAKPLGGYDVDNLARDVMEVANRLEIDAFHYVGMSVGAVVGIRNAAQFPERFLSLALGDGSAESEPIEKVVNYEMLMLEGFAQDPELVIDRIMQVLYCAPFRDNPDNKTVLENERTIILANDGPAVARASAPILRRVDVRHMMPHVKCPTLVFCGELDSANPPEKSQIIADGIHGAELHIFPQTGHQPNVERPKELANLLRHHVDKCAKIN